MSLSQLIKMACWNFTTSNVTSREMGMRLLKRMMKVRKFYELKKEEKEGEKKREYLWERSQNLRTLAREEFI